jgi:phosphomannomutase
VSDRDALQKRVARWIEDDVDPVCRTELQQLLDAGDFAALHERFAAPLEFGTAGLRGELGAGPGRMNRAVVARATYGFCEHLRKNVKDAAERGLCIGYDARHNSPEFAEEAASVAAAAGFRVIFFEKPCPTPLLGFAVLDQRAAGGVMVTASHNPARDNGYKAYWENGAQIIPPHDAVIAAAMERLPSVRALPRMASKERVERGLQRSLGDAFEAHYLKAVAALTGPLSLDAADLRIVYTALHGVGNRLALAALAQAGFTRVSSVREQAEPDADFPTVAFPNPEEKGAMDKAIELAQQTRADVVLANDPDADRLAVIARDAQGELRPLTGNDVGILLADYVLATDKEQHPNAGARCVLSSIVSTPMIAPIAKLHGAHWEPVLTGYKWIGNRAMQLEREKRLRFVFGFEEALGYTTGTLVRDKDGISSAVVAARLAAQLKAEGGTLHDRLETLFRRVGLYASSQISIRLEGASGAQQREAIMAALRKAPPDALGGLPLTAAIDLQGGAVRGTPSIPLSLPPSDALLWEIEGGHRVCVRPSGTEPKIKVYFDVREPVRHDEALSSAQTRARATADALTRDLRARLA